jgi:hypothetical protein
MKGEKREEVSDGGRNVDASVVVSYPILSYRPPPPVKDALFFFGRHLRRIVARAGNDDDADDDTDDADDGDDEAKMQKLRKHAQ